MRVVPCMILLAGLFSGCQAGGPAADRFSAEPLPPPSATMHVTGLSCPLCATNIETPLKRVPGVAGVRVELDQGLVRVQLAGKALPSQQRLAAAVEDAGFTVTRIETP